MRNIHLKFMAASISALLISSAPMQFMAAELGAVPSGTPAQATETGNVPSETPAQASEPAGQENPSDTGETSGSETGGDNGGNDSVDNNQEASGTENTETDSDSENESTDDDNESAENTEEGTENSNESSDTNDSSAGVVPSDELESGEEVTDPSATDNSNTDTGSESGASIEEPAEQGEEASGEVVAPSAGDEFPVNAGDSSESSGSNTTGNSSSSTEEIEPITIISEDDEVSEDSEDSEEIKEEEKTNSETEKNEKEDLSSLSANYLKFLPDYRIEGEKKNEGLKINFDGIYRPGQVSVTALPIPEVTDGDKGLALYLEYYDRNPQYDGRIRDWDNSYYSPATGKWKAPKESDSDYSNSVSVNAALVWAKVSENGLIIPDEGASALEGVRVKDVKFRSDADATLNENGDFYDNVDKRDEKRSYFTIDLAISAAKAGLSKQQVKQIKDSMRGRGSDTAFRFPFGVTKRSLTGNSGQYEKLTLSVDDDGAVKVESLQMKIEGEEEDGETYLSLELPEDSPEDAAAVEGADFAPSEELAGSSAIVKEIADDGSSIVLEGSGNFTGEAVWSQDPETGKYSLN